MIAKAGVVEKRLQRKAKKTLSMGCRGDEAPRWMTSLISGFISLPVT